MSTRWTWCVSRWIAPTLSAAAGDGLSWVRLCVRLGAAIVVSGLGSVAVASAATAPSVRVALEERLVDAPFAMASPASTATADAARAPRLVRLAVDARTLQADAQGRYRFEALDARLAWYRERRIDVWLALDGLPIAVSTPAPAPGPASGGAGAGAGAAATATTVAADAWPRFARALAAHLGDSVRIVELTLPREATDGAALAFELKRAAVELRGPRASLTVAIGVPANAAIALDDFYTADLAPYIDAVVLAAGGAGPAASASPAGPIGRPAGGVPRVSSTQTTGDAADEDDARVRAVRALLDKVDPTAHVFERGLLLPSAPAEAARRFTTAALWRLGSPSVLAAFHAPALDAARAVTRQADALRYLLEGDIVALDARVSGLTLTLATPSAAVQGAQPRPQSQAQTQVETSPATVARHALVYNLTTFGTYLVYAAAPDTALPGAAASRGAAAAGGSTASEPPAVRVSLTIATPARPQLRDPYSGTVRPAPEFVRDAEAGRTTFSAPLRDRPLVIDFNDAVEGVITERSDVSGVAELSVEEIVARHQQVQAAQDVAVRSYTAAVRMEQHFRPSAADAGYDIVTENRFFVDDDSVEWEELSFSVNGAKWTANRPAFPLLQPEKVLSVPLKLRLTADYRYRLGGRQGVDGHECYVVHFDPASGGRTLYRGTVWIDTRTFVRRKLQTVQTNLTAPVVSNEETHEFIEMPPGTPGLPASRATIGGNSGTAGASAVPGAVAGRAAVAAGAEAAPVLLPARVTAKQILLIAGRNVLLEKATTFADYQINAESFAVRRAAARAGERIMYRDTDHGVRYLVKEGDAGERIVSERMTARAKAMAMGVNLDPSFDFPLPIVGINYLDFNFRGPDSQLALLFGGVLALGNIQRPKLFGTKLDGSVDFFAIAVPGNDRTYDDDGVRKQDELLTWPLSAGLNLGYQFTSFQKVTAQYQFQFNGFLKNRETTADYHVPSSTVTNGVGMAYEYRRAGYSLVANGTWYGRLRWQPWGPADALQVTPRTYQKFSVNLSKDWYVGLFNKIHVNGAWFGGRDLDRFSQYQFGMFDDTRVHGVPASGVRYGELAMVRGSYSFNLFEQYRFDLFLEQAFARDPATGVSAGLDLGRKPWDPITGIGVAFTVKAPFDTLLRADVGKAFLPDRYRATGSTVVSVLFLKPL